MARNKRKKRGSVVLYEDSNVKIRGNPSSRVIRRDADTIVRGPDGRGIRLFLAENGESVIEGLSLLGVPEVPDEKEVVELLQGVGAYADETKAQDVENSAPELILFVAAFISPRDQRDALLGCLTERYGKDLTKRGPAWARYMLVRDALATLGPAAAWAAKRAFTGALSALGLKFVLKYFLG
jgi:hypothetical protein